MMRTAIACAFFFSLTGLLCFGALEVLPLFGDHAVLQHGREVPVRGRAMPGTGITVTFAGQEVKAAAGVDGWWEAVLKPLEVSGQGRELVVVSDRGDRITSRDVVVGDVWVCSGQSNMAFPLKSSSGSDRVFSDPDPLIRFFAVPAEFYPYPLETYRGPVGWEETTAETLAWKSAVAYFFAEAIRERVDRPVGLYLAARGGTMIQPFMPIESHAVMPALEDVPVIKKLKHDLQLRDPSLPASRQAYLDGMGRMEAWIDHLESCVGEGRTFEPMPPPPGMAGTDDTVCGLYNTMFAPMERYPVKGMIWYQGESNGGDRKLYTYLLEAYIESMRTRLNGGGTFPFYIVQLANYGPDKRMPGADDGNVGVREAQREVAMSITNCGLAVTHDIGNPTDIHPVNKFDVGRRLARWALNRDYGCEDVLVSGPLFRRQEIEGSRIVLHFDYTGNGLMAGTKDGTNAVVEAEGPPERFAIAGEDRMFVWANTKIEGDTVVVSSPDVPEPRYVRYAYSASPTGRLLYNREGLPASPFKTDPW